MPDRIQFRRDTAANWRSFNTLLAAGEPGFETDGRLFKVGDGVTTWNTLPYANSPNPAIAGGRLSVWQYTPVNPPVPYDLYGHSTPRSILYYVPYKSNLISLWDNASYGWRPRAFDNNTAISLAGLPGNTNYDVFASYVNGSVQLSLKAWGDNWTRAAIPAYPQCGTGGILLWDGVMTECGDVTKRYLGTIRTSAAGGSTQDNWWRRFVYNYDNQVLTTTFWNHGIPHTFASSFFRQWDNGSYGDATAAAQAVNKIQIVTGAPCPISIKLSTYMRYGFVAVMVYGASYQRDSAVQWNGVQPFGAQTGYGYLSSNVNLINPTPLGGGSVLVQSTSVTFGRNEVGLVELWVAEYGYSADSWFLNASISADLMM
jgi:hypothetical protein